MVRYTRRPAYRRKPAYNKRGQVPWYSRKYNAQQLALKAWRGVKYIRGLVNSEMLHADTTYTNSSISGAGAIVHLTALAQNDTSSGRTGNSILLRSLVYRYRLEINASVASNTAITCIIFQDSQQVGDTSPAVSDVLSLSNPESLLNLNTAGRFKIVSRKTFVLTPASGGRNAIEVADSINFQNHVRFNGAASTDVQRNGLYVLFISSEITNYPTVSGTFRIGYHDN